MTKGDSQPHQTAGTVDLSTTGKLKIVPNSQDALHISEESVLEELENLKVYIVDLPSKFNMEIANNSRIEKHLCTEAYNHGCGKGEIFSLQITGYTACYTHQFTAEVVFHERLKESKVGLFISRLSKYYWLTIAHCSSFMGISH